MPERRRGSVFMQLILKSESSRLWQCKLVLFTAPENSFEIARKGFRSTRAGEKVSSSLADRARFDKLQEQIQLFLRRLRGACEKSPHRFLEKALTYSDDASVTFQTSSECLAQFSESAEHPEPIFWLGKLSR
jgi:hypothetical protein